MSIEQQIIGILAGIDQLEDDEGYWETSTGVEFGKQILAGVKTVAQLADDNYKLKRRTIKSLRKGVEDLTDIVTQLTKEKVALKQTLKEISNLPGFRSHESCTLAHQALAKCN